MKMIKSFYLCLTLAIPFLACTSEPDIVSSDLTGSWEVTQATRNGKGTETVVGAYFQFSPEGSLSTNIMNGEVLSGTYLLENEVIRHQPVGHEEMIYHVEKKEQSDEIELRTKISDFNFVFVLEPKSQE